MTTQPPLEPPRLVHGDDAVAKALSQAAAVPPLDPSARAALRGALLRRVAPAPRSGRLVLAAAFALSLLLGIGVTLRFWGPSAAEGPLQLAFSPDAVQRAHSPSNVELRAGTVDLKNRTPTPMVVQTPDLEVAVLAGHVAVEVVNGRSMVTVFEGSAQVRRDGVEVQVRAGEHLTGDDARFERPRLLPPQVGASDGACETRDCLERAAEGDDVRAQTALMRLGLMAMAQHALPTAEAWARRSLARFPDGVLAPEAHLMVLGVLAEQRRDAEATVEANWYLAHAGDSPMAPQVCLLQGDLELRAGRFEQAVRAYAATFEHAPTPALAAEAHYGVAVASLRAGHEDQARAAFEQALRAAPTGPRAAEVTRRLAR